MKDYVGFSLRLPPELHRQIKALAKRDVRSMHGEMLYALWLFTDRRRVYPDETGKDDG